jgi:hypothetical protein
VMSFFCLSKNATTNPNQLKKMLAHARTRACLGSFGINRIGSVPVGISSCINTYSLIILFDCSVSKKAEKI